MQYYATAKARQALADGALDLTVLSVTVLSIAFKEPRTAAQLVSTLKKRPEYWAMQDKVFVECIAKLLRKGYLAQTGTPPAEEPVPQPPVRLSKRAERKQARYWDYLSADLKLPVAVVRQLYNLWDPATDPPFPQFVREMQNEST